MVGGGGDNTVRRRVVSENSTNEQQVDAADEHALLINNSAKKSVVDKLFSSKEETTFIIPHFHKILGFSCLASFLYRFSYKIKIQYHTTRGRNTNKLSYCTKQFPIHLFDQIFPCS